VLHAPVPQDADAADAQPKAMAELEAQELLERVAASQPMVDRALESLKRRCGEKGKPALGRDAAASAASGASGSSRESAPTLYFGACAVAGEAKPWLDAITKETGCFATIFVCDRRAIYASGAGTGTSGRFIRVATNVHLSDGTRATGTVLNPKGIAARNLLAKRPHRGTAYVLGRPYLTAYEPVLSAASEVIGALYVGCPLVPEPAAPAVAGVAGEAVPGAAEEVVGEESGAAAL